MIKHSLARFGALVLACVPACHQFSEEVSASSDLDTEDVSAAEVSAKAMDAESATPAPGADESAGSAGSKEPTHLSIDPEVLDACANYDVPADRVLLDQGGVFDRTEYRSLAECMTVGPLTGYALEVIAAPDAGGDAGADNWRASLVATMLTELGVPSSKLSLVTAAGTQGLVPMLMPKGAVYLRLNEVPTL